MTPRTPGPVILNICGEYTCRGITPTRLFPAQLAAATGALILSLEHRFYGESVPRGMDLTTGNLALLTAAQGLADLDSALYPAPPPLGAAAAAVPVPPRG